MKHLVVTRCALDLQTARLAGVEEQIVDLPPEPPAPPRPVRTRGDSNAAIVHARVTRARYALETERRGLRLSIEAAHQERAARTLAELQRWTGATGGTWR